MQEKTERVLSRRRMLAFLDELEASGGITRSLYVPGGGQRAETSLPADVAAVISKSKTGAVVFYAPSQVVVVLPPFPVVELLPAPGCQVQPLRSLLTRDYLLALILVRLGTYAIGLCEGERLVVSKVGTGLVHAHHKKGGSSAQRYGLHREKQIESFVGRICAHIKEEIEPRAKELDYVVYGGSRETLLALKKGCPSLAKFESKTLPSLLDIPEPNRATLEKTVGRIWTTRVITYSC